MNWWRRLLRRNEMEEQLERELRFHLDQHTSDLIARGLSPEQARREARLALGGPQQVKEQCRDARGTRWLEDLLAGRSLRLAHASATPQLRGRCGLDAGARHRRDHRHVHRDQQRAPQAAGLSGFRTAGYASRPD